MPYLYGLLINVSTLCNILVLSPTLSARKLNFQSFAAFKGCNWHIITIQANKPSDLEEKLDPTAYEVDEIYSPSIRSKHYFIMQMPPSYLADKDLQQMLQCGNLLATLNQSSSDFKFQVSPSPRQNCIAQFYIDPPNCPSWRKPKALSNTKQIFTPTIFIPVMDYRVRLTRNLRQSISWRWAFIHVKTIHSFNISPFVYKHDIEDIVRRELGTFWAEIPSSPLTLTFFIWHNTSNAFKQDVISTIDFTYIVSEIETQTRLLVQLMDYSTLHRHQDKATNSFSIPDISESNLVYKLYRFNIKEQTSFSDLESIIPFEMYRRAPFFQNHLGSSTTNKAYPTNWNKSEHGLGDVVHSLLLTSNISSTVLFNNLYRMGMHNFLGNQWPTVQKFLPETKILFSLHGEGYPVFPNTNDLYFVTCAPRGTSSLTLVGLVSAFDGYVWLLVIASALVTKLISYLVEKYLAMIRKAGFVHQGIFFTLKILIGEHISMNIFKSKVILISWLFVGIIISNAYEGENISQLISPPEYLKYREFNRVTKNNFTVYTAISLFSKSFISSMGRWYYRDLHSSLASVGSSFRSKIYEQLKRMEWLPFTMEELLMAEHDEYFVPKMVECTKEIFLAELSVVMEMYIKLKTILDSRNDYNVNYLTISNGPLIQVFYRLHFKHFPVPPRILRRWMHMLADSGLIQFWIGWDTRLVHWNYYLESAKETSSQPQKISLAGNISGIFLLALGLLFIIFIPTLALEKLTFIRQSQARKSRAKKLINSDSLKVFPKSHIITLRFVTRKHPLVKSASNPEIDQTSPIASKFRAKSVNLFPNSHPNSF